jgi:tetratricopeptide (TPR) repeat protein
LRDKADKTASPARRGARAADIASYVLIAGAVVLGWQIVLQPFVQRAPVEAAIRLAPTSPLVLRRAAEAELAAGRNDNAAALGRDALARSPFDVRALRVVGLSEARAGRVDQADDILTLAGNWSLRDDPAHAWLVEHRLRQGDYVSAFAHADTLVRRRQDIQPEVFRLFTVAGIEDPRRSLPVTAGLLAANPPWRPAYLAGLNQSPEELQVQMNLAILLQASRAPLSNAELQQLYRTLLSKGQIDAVRTVRARLNRPAAGAAVTNGDFSDSAVPEPFQWRLVQKAGVTAEIVADDLRPANPALRIDYDGYATARIAEQLTFLPAGPHRFVAEVKSETGDPAARLVWTLACASGGRAIASAPAGRPNAAASTWTTVSARIDVPDGCPAQWLRLETRADDRRSPIVVWFDRVRISPAG